MSKNIFWELRLNAFKEKQLGLRAEFEKLDRPKTANFIRKDGKVLRGVTFVSHCPICEKQTELRAVLRDMPEWECAQQTGIHTCSCTNIIDGHIYFRHAVRIWYGKNEAHGDVRIASYDVDGIHESRPQTPWEKWLRKFKKFLFDLS